jgi:hypothetical protein
MTDNSLGLTTDPSFYTLLLGHPYLASISTGVCTVSPSSCSKRHVWVAHTHPYTLLSLAGCQWPFQSSTCVLPVLITTAVSRLAVTSPLTWASYMPLAILTSMYLQATSTRASNNKCMLWANCSSCSYRGLCHHTSTFDCLAVIGDTLRTVCPDHKLYTLKALQIVVSNNNFLRKHNFDNLRHAMKSHSPCKIILIVLNQKKKW